MNSLQHLIECWPFAAVMERIHCGVVLPAKVFRELAAWIERFGGREASIGYRMIAAESLRHLEYAGEDVANHYRVGEPSSVVTEASPNSAQMS